MSTRSEQGSHFWFMSFMVRNAIGLAIEERVGHWTPSPGMTRFDALEEIRRQVVAVSPVLADAALISFDIQPNQL